MSDPDPKYGLGLEPGVNRLVDHNPLWPQAFAEEAARIKAALGERALAIEHYGSTAVPGLRAKPIIDLQIGVADIRDGLARRKDQFRGAHLRGARSSLIV